MTLEIRRDGVKFITSPRRMLLRLTPPHGIQSIFIANKVVEQKSFTAMKLATVPNMGSASVLRYSERQKKLSALVQHKHPQNDILRHIPEPRVGRV